VANWLSIKAKQQRWDTGVNPFSNGTGAAFRIRLPEAKLPKADTRKLGAVYACCRPALWRA
jgi:hypothetical protein